tara:strand:+ start:159 stop:362 length:204 start_codon:yes stop_codon:yes gene_type:complete
MVGNAETEDVTLEEMVLELVAEDEEDEEVDAGPHSPTIDGTASGPVPMATKFVPQFLALARCRFWLS